jgi:hypothetical protein
MERWCEQGLERALECRCEECMRIAQVLNKQDWDKVKSRKEFVSLAALGQSCVNWFDEQADAYGDIRTRQKAHLSFRIAEGVYTAQLDAFDSPTEIPLRWPLGKVILVLRHEVEPDEDRHGRWMKWLTGLPEWARALSAGRSHMEHEGRWTVVRIEGGEGEQGCWTEPRIVDRRSIKVPPARPPTIEEQEAVYWEIALQSGLPNVRSIVRYLWYCVDPEGYHMLLGDELAYPKPAVRITSFVLVARGETITSEATVYQQAQVIHDFSAHHLCLDQALMNKARQVAADHLAWWRGIDLSILATLPSRPASGKGVRTGRFADLIDMFSEGRLSADEFREQAEAQELERIRKKNPEAQLDTEDRSEIYSHLRTQLRDRAPELEARFLQEVSRRKRGRKPKN